MAYSNWDKIGMAAGLGQIGGSLASLFGGNKSPAGEAMGYYGQIPGAMQPYYQPWIDQAGGMMGGLGNTYQGMFSDPAKFTAGLGEGYKESPGYKFALEQALHAGKNASAAGGMAGSPLHEQEAMQTASGLASQDYQNYMNNVMKTLGMGLQGGENVMGRGYNAGTGYASELGSNMAQMGKLAQQKAIDENTGFSKGIGGITSGLGQFLPFFMGL